MPLALKQVGLWQRVFETLAKNADNEYATIDPTIVRTHQRSVEKEGA